MKGAQLPLAVQLRDSASFETFFAGPNAEALAALHGGRENLLLYGPPGSGKSHLLQAAARDGQAAYLPLATLAAHGPALLEGYDDAPVLCVDEIDTALTRRDWCIALLRLLDARRTRGARYIIAAPAPPEHLDIALPDLRTRLAACAVFGLQALNDAQRAELLRQRAQARGLHMPDDVSRWLLNHLPRDTGSLLDALEQLDRAALSAKRRLTLPLAQATLPPAPARAAVQTESSSGS